MTGADGENTITTHRKARARPPIQIRETDAERIGNLAIEAE
jgi:regulator of nucleoside diphosphate kinase